MTASQSDYQPEPQVTFDYSDVRLRDQQTATKSDYTDLTHHSSGNGYASRATGQRYGTNTASKMQVFNSTPPNQAALPSSHKERLSSMAANPFQAELISWEILD